MKPYVIQGHRLEDGRIGIEMRPATGQWSPFTCGIPSEEKENLQPNLIFGPSNEIPAFPKMKPVLEEYNVDSNMYVWQDKNVATPTHSFYLMCNEIPSRIIFGVNGTMYDVNLLGAENTFFQTP